MFINFSQASCIGTLLNDSSGPGWTTKGHPLHHVSNRRGKPCRKHQGFYFTKMPGKNQFISKLKKTSVYSALKNR